MIIPSTYTIGSNYVINISGLPNNLPMTADNTKTYVISTVNNTANGTGFVATGIQVLGSNLSMYFNGGGAALASSTLTPTITVQQVVMISCNGTAEIALSNISQYAP